MKPVVLKRPEGVACGAFQFFAVSRNRVGNGPLIPTGYGPTLAAEQGEHAVIMGQYRRMIAPHVTSLTGNRYLLPTRGRQLPCAMDFIKRVTIHARHPFLEMDIRGKHMVFASVYSWACSASNKRSPETSMEILFE